MAKVIYLVYADIAYNPNFDITFFTSKNKALKEFEKRVKSVKELMDQQSNKGLMKVEADREDYKEIHFNDNPDGSGNGETYYFKCAEINQKNELW